MSQIKPSRATSASPGLVLVLVLALLALAPAVSHAALAGTMSIQFPEAVSVGQGVPATLTLRNQNTGAEGATANTVCNAGDGGLCSGDPGILLVASCAALASAQCSVADAGVFGFSATGGGRAGTSCEGMSFAIDGVDPSFGTVRFTPAGGGHVILPKTGSTCSIDFTLTAQRSPAVDFAPAQIGLQTAQAGEHSQFGTAIMAPVKVRDTSSGMTVHRAPVSLVTSASREIGLGDGTLIGTATVNGRVSPVEGATVDFRLHGPNDAACARAPVFTTQVPYPAAGGPVSTAPFNPAATGTYRWSTSFSGDANNLPVAGACSGATTLVRSGSGDRDRDGVPNPRDACPSVAGDRRNGCPSALGADIRGVWRVNELLSKLVSLTVRAPVGSRIEVRCTARAGVCPFKSRVVRKTTRRTTGLTRSFGSPRIYPAGTKISVFVTKARRRGTYERVLTRTGRRLPSVVNRCLGTRLKVQRCP